jgi:hypothetical protein
MHHTTVHIIVGAVLFAVGLAFGYGLAHKYPLGVAPVTTYSSEGGHEGPIHAGENNNPTNTVPGGVNPPLPNSVPGGFGNSVPGGGSEMTNPVGPANSSDSSRK